jgi:hypothetical protein
MSIGLYEYCKGKITLDGLKDTIKLGEIRYDLMISNNIILNKICDNPTITIDILKYIIDYMYLREHDYYYDSLDHLCGNPSVTIDMLTFMIQFHLDKLQNTMNIYKMEPATKLNLHKSLNYMCKNSSMTLEMIDILIKHGAQFDQINIWALCTNPAITIEIIKYVMKLNIMCDFTNLCGNTSITLGMIEFIKKPNFYLLSKNESATIEIWSALLQKDNIDINIIPSNIEIREWIVERYINTLDVNKYLCTHTESCTIKIIKILMINGANHKQKSLKNNYATTIINIVPNNIKYMLHNGYFKLSRDYKKRCFELTHHYNRLLISNHQIPSLIKDRHRRIITLLQLIRYTIAGPIILDEMLNEIFI